MSFIKLNQSFGATGKTVEVFDEQISSLSGLKSWVSASDNYAIKNGSTVSNLLPMGGTENGFTQTVAANQPTIIAGAINGRPALSFVAANINYMKYDGKLNGNGQFTKVVVFKATQGNLGNILSNNNSPRHSLFVRASEAIQEVGGTNITAPYNRDWCVLIAQYDAATGSAKMSMNGSILSDTASASSFNSDLYLGASAGGAGPANIEVAEVMVFDRLLLNNTNDSDIVARYFKAKYNL